VAQLVCGASLCVANVCGASAPFLAATTCNNNSWFFMHCIVHQNPTPRSQSSRARKVLLLGAAAIDCMVTRTRIDNMYDALTPHHLAVEVVQGGR